MIRKALVISICLVLLVGCVSAKERRLRLANQDHAECLSYGAQLGSNMYLKCRHMLKQQRAIDADRYQRANKNLGIMGRQLMQMGAPRTLQ